ncbi:Bifunctional (p)ppGpp synthase/hydrolase RelA [Cardinium endosymbiont of Culicoides punctatus]|nr:Bifunctional (p)ppGpp synthase/hydrolase RelA [Cardinium endosymbiont of Culicoides punctatus]
MSLTRSGLYKFSNLLLQRIKEERRFHLNANDIKPVVIDPVIFKVRGDIHGLDEPMQLLLYNQATQQTLQADPELFERLLAINLLAISKSEQALDATVTLTIVDTTLKYYYQDVNQEKDSLSEKLDALAFCMSTSAHPEHILSTYQVDDMPTTVFLPKTASKLYQVESRHIVQAHGGYVEITETEEKLVCLYILPIAGKRFMRLKTYDPVDLDREVAETPESLAQEKELVLLVTKKTSLTKEEVEKTIAFIKKAHGLTRRKSGEPYYTHPMAVAKILLEVTKDPEVILAGLLHDIVEDTLVTLEQIELLYGKQVAYLVDMVTHYNTHGYRFLFAQYIIEDMLSNCKDIRVVYIKLADRLHNMRTIGFRNKEDQERIARETACFHIRWGAKYNENNELSPWISELKSICRQRIQPGLLPLIEQ